MEPVRLELKLGNVMGYSRPSPDRPGQNQDSYGIVEVADGLVLVVCDGMGGHKDGDKASSLVVESIVDFLSTHSKEASGLILEAIDSANNELIQKLPSSGTTLCLSFVSSEGVRFFSVGDSPGYLLSEGVVCHKTNEQTVAGVAVEAGLLDEAQAEEHPEGHHLLNCLGDESPSIEVSTLFQLPKGALLVLCSDGFSRSIDLKGFVTYSNQMHFDEYYELMLKHSFDGMEVAEQYDDITFLAFQKN